MKIVWNGMDLVVLVIGAIFLLLIGFGLVALDIYTKIKERRKKRNERPDKA
jgi:multisubunit Na+/H+ antiporter MnhG subunit